MADVRMRSFLEAPLKESWGSTEGSCPRPCPPTRRPRGSTLTPGQSTEFGDSESGWFCSRCCWCCWNPSIHGTHTEALSLL